MNYADPKLRSILAGEYVLGTMRPRVRARFERLMRYDAGLARLVGDWAERLGKIDGATKTVTPPPRVWSAIDVRTRPRSVEQIARGRAPWIERAVAAVAVVAVAVLLVDRFAAPPAPAPVAEAAPKPQVVAVLSDSYGSPGWIVTFDRPHARFDVAALREINGDAQHSYELWVVEDNATVKLGVIGTKPDQVVAIPAAEVPRSGLVLAVSLEPAGGAPGDSPTGPVVYRGGILQGGILQD